MFAVSRFISRWLQPIEKGDWEEITAFEEKYGKKYHCSAVFATYLQTLDEV